MDAGSEWVLTFPLVLRWLFDKDIWKLETNHFWQPTQLSATFIENHVTPEKQNQILKHVQNTLEDQFSFPLKVSY